MSVAYASAGDALTASKWNALVTAANAVVMSALAGESAVFASIDNAWQRVFFFGFNPLSPPLTLHPRAYNVLSAYSGAFTTNYPALFRRQYNDTDIVTALAALSVTNSSSKYLVALLSTPSASAWTSTVYPAISGHTVTGNNLLDASLKVNTRTISGTPYRLTFQDATTAEAPQPFIPIDVFANGNLTWDSSWNKYSLVRVHNVSLAAITCTFGSVTQTINTAGCYCFRFTGGAWIGCTNYFHTFLIGDGRFLSSPYNIGECNVLNPATLGVVMQNLLGITNTVGRSFHPADMWDYGSLLTPNYFPATPGNSTPLGDLLIHKGQVVAIDYTTNAVQQFTYDTIANLATHLAAVGLAARNLAVNYSDRSGSGGSITTRSANTLEIYTPDHRRDLADLSCPLITVATRGNNMAASAGVSQTSSPKSIALPALLITAGRLTGNIYDPDLFYRAFMLTDSVGSISTWLSSLTSDLSYSNVGVYQTPFGPVIAWDETMPMDQRFPTNIFYDFASIGNSICRADWNGTNLILRHQKILEQSASLDAFSVYNFQVFPKAYSPYPAAAPTNFLQWNWPRQERRFRNNRFWYRDPADTPWIPSSANGQPATFDWFVQSPSLKSFYEQAPISQDAITFSPSFRKPGNALMGQHSGYSDWWGPFSYWLLHKTDFVWACRPNETGYYPDLTKLGFSHLGIGSNFYSANATNMTAAFGSTNWSLTDAATLDTQSPVPNVLAIQAEHYNTVASMVNALPPVIKFPSGYDDTDYSYSRHQFTLNFAAGNIVIVNGGTGYAVGDPLAFNLKVASILGTGSTGPITSVVQNGSVVVNTYGIYGTPQRPFSLDGYGSAGSGATCDTTSADGSNLNFIPNYSPITDPVHGQCWPRTCYFAWWGSIYGNDPLTTYFNTLGIPIQTALPDGYNTAFSGPQNTISAHYRWLAITDVQTWYASNGLPFALNQLGSVFSFAGTTFTNNSTGHWMQTGVTSLGISGGGVGNAIVQLYGTQNDYLLVFVPSTTGSCVTNLIAGSTNGDSIHFTVMTGTIVLVPLDSSS